MWVVVHESRGAEETAYVMLVINKGLCIATYWSIPQLYDVITLPLKIDLTLLNPLSPPCF